MPDRMPKKVPRPTSLSASTPRMTAAPPMATASPTQKRRPGRSPKNNIAPSPTQMGAVLPISVGFVAPLMRMPVFQKNRSPAKNSPARMAMSVSRRAGRPSRAMPRPKGTASKTAATPMR